MATQIVTTPVKILNNDTLATIWESADPMIVGVRHSKRVTRYPVEDGSTRNDHAVVDPVEITIRFVLTGGPSQAFSAIRGAFLSNDLLTIQTRAGVYFDMMITEIPQDQSSDSSDSVFVDVRLLEWREVVPEYGELTIADVKAPAQSNTVRRGSVTPKEPPRDKSSLLSRLVGGAK